MSGINDKSVMIKFDVVLMASVAFVTLDDKCSDTFQDLMLHCKQNKD
jgi:hypothetical protein